MKRKVAIYARVSTEHEAQKIRFKYENKIKLSSNEILELMEKILRRKIEQNPYVLKKY